MPVLTDPTYTPPFWLRNGHVNTVYGGRLRAVVEPDYQAERIDTPDGDFLDLEWLRGGHSRLVILCHGLEGDARRTYMTGMAQRLAPEGFDVLAWSYRGCSGVPNRKLRSYHSGATEDLEVVVERANRDYQDISVVGFSLGGNVTLKYLGERGEDTPVRRAVTFSVPCDLAAGSHHLAKPHAALYMQRFMRSLRAKVRAKDKQFPGQLDLTGLDEMKTFAEFDGRYTAPLNGFKDAEDYWARASSKPFLSAIRRPALLLSALDDPFLPDACYPFKEARSSTHFSFLAPKHGGHVGFMLRGESWAENVCTDFLRSNP